MSGRLTTSTQFEASATHSPTLTGRLRSTRERLSPCFFGFTPPVGLLGIRGESGQYPERVRSARRLRPSGVAVRDTLISKPGFTFCMDTLQKGLLTRDERPNHANGGIALLLQSTRFLAIVAEPESSGRHTGLVCI